MKLEELINTLCKEAKSIDNVILVYPLDKMCPVAKWYAKKSDLKNKEKLIFSCVDVSDDIPANSEQLFTLKEIQTVCKKYNATKNIEVEFLDKNKKKREINDITFSQNHQLIEVDYNI